MEIDRAFRDKLADILRYLRSLVTQHPTTFRRIFDNAGAPRLAEE